MCWDVGVNLRLWCEVVWGFRVRDGVRVWEY